MNGSLLNGTLLKNIEIEEFSEKLLVILYSEKKYSDGSRKNACLKRLL